MTGTASEGRDRLARALDVAVFAPLGLGLYLKDMAPTFLGMFITRGRAEVDRRQEQVDRRVGHAKGMGEVAVAFGLPMLRKKADEEITAARGRAATTLHSAGLRSDAPRGSRARRSDATGTSRSTPDEAVARDDAATAEPPERSAPPSLAIPGYDALSASQVVQRLTGLAGDELDAVREYESSHRNRRTILGKIDQLAR